MNRIEMALRLIESVRHYNDPPIDAAFELLRAELAEREAKRIATYGSENPAPTGTRCLSCAGLVGYHFSPDHVSGQPAPSAAAKREEG